MRRIRAACRLAVVAAALGCLPPPVVAATGELGRLFYTPEQRAELEAARARKITRVEPDASARPAPSTPQRYDGVVVRSDGRTTRWVDGRPEVGPSSVKGLKPGQVRADGKVYEPYQVLPPAEAPADTGGTAP